MVAVFKNQTPFFLLLIVIVAAFLRFYQLGVNPPSLTWDEAAWGYNAYSILTTGRDEFGKFLPLDYLESFGDFKPPMYAYVTVLPVLFFGLSEFSTRFASAFFGVLTVLATYFLARRIFYISDQKENYGLFAALFLALSPWHINLSRAAFEANVATFFIVTGLLFFLYGIQKNGWFLTLSAVSFVLSLYTFNTARIVSPLLVFILFVSTFKLMKKRMKYVSIAFLIGLGVLMPTLPFLFSDQARLRYKEVNIFSDPEIVKRANQHIENAGGAWWSKILNNRRIFYGEEYLKHYFDNLNPVFLFIKGDGNPKFSTQQVGQLFLWDAPFLIAGIFLLFRKREGFWYILPLWFLIGIIPAATARETPHALRIATVLPIPQIITAYAFASLLQMKPFSFFRFRIRKGFVVSLLLVLLGVQVTYYLHFYYQHYPRLYSGEWQQGYKESIAFIEREKSNFDRVYMTTDLGRPYIYFLFYTKADPHAFQGNATITRDAFGFVTVKRYGKYYFERDLPVEVDNSQRSLFINTPDKVPENAKDTKVFRLQNGELSLVAYTL